MSARNYEKQLTTSIFKALSVALQRDNHEGVIYRQSKTVLFDEMFNFIIS